MTNTVRIPRVFYLDHQERDLPTPVALGETSQHIIIDRADPALPELISDARHYADSTATDAPAWVRMAAQALLKALEPLSGYTTPLPDGLRATRRPGPDEPTIGEVVHTRPQTIITVRKP